MQTETTPPPNRSPSTLWKAMEGIAAAFAVPTFVQTPEVSTTRAVIVQMMIAETVTSKMPQNP